MQQAEEQLLCCPYPTSCKVRYQLLLISPTVEVDSLPLDLDTWFLDVPYFPVVVVLLARVRNHCLVDFAKTQVSIAPTS